jgi:MoaA/NifB/PqqE/SkfB family radical SAM enzyme
LLGRVDNSERWYALPGLVARRILHIPDGSREYRKPVTIPEIGICLDLLTHLSINRFGHVSVCVRFDPEGKGIIGDLNKHSLSEIWNGEVRKWYIDCHKQGHREYLRLCSQCDYYGVPTSP